MAFKNVVRVLFDAVEGLATDGFGFGVKPLAILLAFHEAVAALLAFERVQKRRVIFVVNDPDPVG